MKIQESAENYLETILILAKRQEHVRSIDIVHEMHFSKPSVSIAMKNLRQNGLILTDNDGYISLTESGLRIAESVYDRHTCLTSMLVNLGVDPVIAAEDACRMEHVLSQESFDAIKKHLKENKHG